MVESGTNLFRTLIEVRGVDEKLGIASVVVDQWSKEVIDIPIDIIQPPVLLDVVMKGGVLSAMVDLSAEKAEDLQLRDFQIPQPQALDD